MRWKWSVQIVVLLAGFAVAGPARPRLVVDRAGGESLLYVETARPRGAPARVLLRRTPGPIEPGETGFEPTGRAAFATWTERAGATWFSYSRDGGAHWHAAAPLAEEIRLRAGAVRPGEPMPPPESGLTAPPGSRLFIVQFKTIGLPEFREALARAGAEVHQYLPHNAHIVRVDPARAAEIARLDFVRRVAPYAPSYRLSRDLLDWLGDAAAPPERMRVRVVALEWGPAGKRRIAEAARALGAEVAALWPSGEVLELFVDRRQLRRIAAHDDVLWIDRWSPPETDMDLVREDAGDNWLEANFGWCGQGVRGEVMDVGIEQDHMDFDGIMMHTPASVESHGTSTYGIVFGNGDRDGDGSAKGTGHMPCAEQGIFADFDEVGDRFLHTQELKSAPYFAAFQTNSWGSARTRSYNSYSREMDDIIWRLDIAITQSQSNSGNQDSRPQAWAKNIISVGGIRHHDTLDPSDDNWGGGASIGPAEDGRIKPDVSYWYDSIFTTTTGNGYTSGFGGTSAATPEVAGVLGLMAEMWSENVWNTNPVGTTVFERLPHFSTLKALLINNAQQYDFDGTGHDLTRVHQGWGRPSVRLAEERAAQSFIVDQETPLQIGELASYEIDVQPGESELKVTLVYPDPPGTTSATLHRINDLDLRVTSPSGILYYGNHGLDRSPYSTPGGQPNGVDTVENVFVLSPEDGIWTVEIEAREVNQDAFLDTPQADVAFSLVVTGGTGKLCTGPSADFTAAPNPARVGEQVLFDSTVSGGAGPPFTYRWDFDSDGVRDSTAADPVHVYHRPFDGLVRLTARDAANCPSRAEHAMTVTGPDLRYNDYVNLTEIEGNGNGAVDPGEIWELTVNLRNDGNEDAIGVSADLVPDTANPGPVSVLEGSALYGDIPVGIVASGAPAYRFQIGQDFPCGEDAVFTLTNITSTDPANVYPDEIGVVRVLVGGAGPAVAFYSDGFETNLGWTAKGGGEWQIGPPRGLGGGSSIPGFNPNPDPDVAYDGSQVLGNDLSGLGLFQGNYEDGITSTDTSPPIDASGAVGVSLEFWRWLNVFPTDVAAVEVSNDGVNWTTLFSTDQGVADDTWVLMSFDVSAIADRSPSFQVRFRLESDAQGTTSGWNVDDLVLRGVTRNSCEPFGRSSPGVSDGLTVTRSPAGQLDLAWGADCAGSGFTGVYRGDLRAGLASAAPEPGLCSVSGTSATVPEGAGPADFFLVVPNDGAFEGSYGTDAGGARRPPAPAACFPTDRVDACAP